MSIPNQDIKILWSKAAGRCSMPDCRKLLTESSHTHPAGAVITGENCHIIAEKQDGPRGLSQISNEERNRYPNLILLCSTHHKIIDTDVTAWPAEKLHEIKKQHENWVESNLNQFKNSDIDIYNHLISSALQKLKLNQWDIISDHAVQNHPLISWIDGIYEFNAEVSFANWPHTQITLEKSIQELARRGLEYAKHYTTLAHIVGQEAVTYQEDRTWKRNWLPQSEYDRLSNRSEIWQTKNFLLLKNLTHAINEFSDCVRQFINPSFFLIQGRFVIHDYSGYMNNLTPCFIKVDRYQEIEN